MCKITDDIELQIRLFLSVDISGSTNLKNTKNYMNLLSRYSDLQKICDRIIKEPTNTVKNTDNSIIYEILEDEELDWPKIIKNTFSDFHNMFIKALEEQNLFPWKVLGDELIYSLKLDDGEDLQKKLLAFYKTLRNYDKQLCDKKSIRLKGSAWVASFPIRNKVIEIPSPQLYFNDDKKYIPYPYPKEDYLGPEMDIGFRIGKCVAPGFIVVSIELAYLLGSVNSSDQFRLGNVGWEQLKGVWGGRHYPIYWIALPDSYKDKEDYTYNEYCLWEIETDKFLSKWHKIKTNDKNLLVEAKTAQSDIREIITKLPSNLGVCKPYFPNELQDDDDKKILELLEKLRDYRSKSAKQEDAENGIDAQIDPDKPFCERFDNIIKNEKNR